MRDYTTRALKELDGQKAKTGGHWVADEMQVKVGGKKMWLWNVMDSETRYILASYLTPRRDARAARMVLRKAANARTNRPRPSPRTSSSHIGSPSKRFCPKPRHMQSDGLRADINNNLSEQLQGTFRDRIKTLRGMDSRKTGQHYLDGWMLTYNNFRGHESLRNKTPAYRAKVDVPFKEWARRGKSRGRASPQDGESAASLAIDTETEIATADSRPAKGRRSGKGKAATGVQNTEAGISEGGEGQEKESAAAVGAAHSQATQQELDLEGT